MATKDDDQLDTSGLSPEEKAAIADTSDQDELDSIIGDEEDEVVTTGEEATDEVALSAEEQSALDETEEETEAEVDTAAAETPAVAAATEPEAVVEEDKPAFNYMLPVNLVEDFDKKLEDIKNDKVALRAKFDEGDMNLAEYEDAREALNDKAYDLKTQQSTALNNAEANKQAGIQRWEVEQEVFFNQDANSIYADKYIGAAFNQAVIDLANDPKNANWSGPKFLAEADKLVRKSFNLTAPAKEEAVAKPTIRKPNLTAVPKSLANLPNAETDTTKGGEFAHLDKLEGLELEQALAKLTDAQQQRYAIAN